METNQPPPQQRIPTLPARSSLPVRCDTAPKPANSAKNGVVASSTENRTPKSDSNSPRMAQIDGRPSPQRRDSYAPLSAQRRCSEYVSNMHPGGVSQVLLAHRAAMERLQVPFRDLDPHRRSDPRSMLSDLPFPGGDPSRLRNVQLQQVLMLEAMIRETEARIALNRLSSSRPNLSRQEEPRVGLELPQSTCASLPRTEAPAQTCLPPHVISPTQSNGSPARPKTQRPVGMERSSLDSSYPFPPPGAHIPAPQPTEPRPSTPPQPSSSSVRDYVDIVNSLDILCGRGGKSNHHEGNKKYRHVVAYMKRRYQHCPGKSQKTDLSRQIVEYCASNGARFLKKEENTGKYYVLTKDEARRKTSQALREPKALKWTTM